MTYSCGQKFYASARNFLLGDIVNTNAVYIAKELASIGVNVYHQAVVGDNTKRLKEQLERSFSQCDLVVLTGGLGPTCRRPDQGDGGGAVPPGDGIQPGSLRRHFTAVSPFGPADDGHNRKQAYLPVGGHSAAKSKRHGARPDFRG